MKLEQQDYEDRKTRVASGAASDDDCRLVKLYEREGYAVKPAPAMSVVTEPAPTPVPTPAVSTPKTAPRSAKN